MKVIKFYIDDINQDYRVIGSTIDENGETIPVGFYSSIFSSAYRVFSFYSTENGFECQRVIIRKV